MKKKEMLYEGKAKKVYATENPELYIVSYKDDATAFNGLKKGTIAGKAAHLAGAFAANTLLPVIGVPIKSSTLDGLDALLSTVQMPQGMPVATVAIDGAANAALLAAQMIALSDEALAGRIAELRRAQTEKVLQKDAEIRAQFE